jgi:hypothetical protein
VRKNFEDSEKKWGKVTPAQAIGWNDKSQQMYTVDALGKLRSFCLKDMVTDTREFVDNGTNRKESMKEGIHVYKSICMCVCICICIYVYVNIYIYIYIVDLELIGRSL